MKRDSAPDGVPGGAIWDAAHKYWRVGEASDGGVLQGPHRLYRTNGALLAEVSYVDGKVDGTFRKYHPNGELAREGEYRRGTPIGREVAYASTAHTDEPLQKCCVPTGAVKLVLNHFDGGHFEEDFYDEQDRVLLPDGSLQPERPSTVPPEARYKPHDQLWRTESYTKGKRTGTWRYWSVTGELLEVAPYENNQVHGQREIWRNAALYASWHYVAGVRHGAGWELVPPNTYENAAIVRQYGEFYHGVPVGTWRYVDQHEHTVLDVELGPALDEVSERDVAFCTTDMEVEPVGHPLYDYLLALRRAGTEGRQAMQRVLAHRPAWVTAGSERWLRALHDERLPRGKYLARLLEGLRRGAVAQDVLCVMARLLVSSPHVASSLTELGLTLAPAHADLTAVRVLALIELGRVQDALDVNQTLQALDQASYHDLKALLRVTFPSFDFWPNATVLEPEPSDELPHRVEQDLSTIRKTMVKVALRLQKVRVALSLRGEVDTAQSHWLPPSCASLLTEEDVELEKYEFDAVDAEGAGDHVIVNEDIELDGYTLSELMSRARIEWGALCWLAFGVGSNEVQVPSTLLPQPAFGHALTTAFARLYRVADQLKTRGYRARAQGVPDAEWEGLPISSLPERLLIQAQAEFSEMRAVLFFLGDGSCKSLWQDDLRG